MKVFWEDTEETILIREFAETWTWDSYQANLIKMRQMVRAVKHDVFIILDCRRIQSVPKDSLSYFREANRNFPPSVLMYIFVSESPVIRALINLLQRLAPEDFRNFHCVSTLEEAHEKISQTPDS